MEEGKRLSCMSSTETSNEACNFMKTPIKGVLRKITSVLAGEGKGLGEKMKSGVAHDSKYRSGTKAIDKITSEKKSRPTLRAITKPETISEDDFDDFDLSQHKDEINKNFKDLPDSYKSYLKQTEDLSLRQYYIDIFNSFSKSDQDNITSLKAIVFEVLDHRTQSLVDAAATQKQLIKRRTGTFTLIEQPQWLFKIINNFAHFNFPLSLKDIASGKWKSKIS